jgi:hypothetical protein
LRSRHGSENIEHLRRIPDRLPILLIAGTHERPGPASMSTFPAVA